MRFFSPLAILALLSSVSATARGEVALVDRGAYSLVGTHDFLLTASSRGDYRILVAVPPTEPPAEGFPVLYVLDANACFGTVVEAQRMLSPRSAVTGVGPAVIVGIAYPGNEAHEQARRTLDLTTPTDPAKLPTRPGGAVWPATGGADEFLEFIETELKPRIEDRFPVDRRRQAIFGHSLGGLFVLHTLFTKPDAFQCYLAASPSVWWNDYALLAEERAFRDRCERAPVAARVLITTAELEKGRGPAANMPATPASSAFGSSEDLAKRLAAFADRGLVVDYEEIPRENHGSVLPVALNRGLRFASGANRHGPDGG